LSFEYARHRDVVSVRTETSECASYCCVFELQMVGTLSLGPQSQVRDVWQNFEDVGYCFELTTVTDGGDVKTNIFMVSYSSTLGLTCS